MSKIVNDLNRINKELSTVPNQGFRKFQSITPKKTGYAQRNTQLNGDVIAANYNYAGALNAGKSKQAPQGMTDPTIRHLRPIVKKILGV